MTGIKENPETASETSVKRNSNSINIQRSKSQNKGVILETVEIQKPETTRQLTVLMKEKTALPEKEITNLIIQLENENRLTFANKTRPSFLHSKNYLLSNDIVWYWITLAIAEASAVAVFSISENAYPLTYVRQVLALVFMLFLPGYAFVRALFPYKLPIPTSSENMGIIERVALSIGLSLLFTPMIGLLLSFTPWGFAPAPITLGLLLLTVAFAFAAILRENRSRNNSSIL